MLQVDRRKGFPIRNQDTGKCEHLQIGNLNRMGKIGMEYFVEPYETVNVDLSVTNRMSSSLWVILMSSVNKHLWRQMPPVFQALFKHQALVVRPHFKSQVLCPCRDGHKTPVRGRREKLSLLVILLSWVHRLQHWLLTVQNMATRFHIHLMLLK